MSISVSPIAIERLKTAACVNSGIRIQFLTNYKHRPVLINQEPSKFRNSHAFSHAQITIYVES